MINTVGWRSPSNIALVKYWGKHGNQLPANPSISFTLSTSVTETFLHWEEARGKGGNIEVLLDGKPAPDFLPKIEQFFDRIADAVPFFGDYNYRIETHNSFPHSSGIASSASGMSALALCTLSMAEQLGMQYIDFYREASLLARLGSGSASRSVYGPLAIWGKHKGSAGSSNDFAIAFAEVHPVFTTFQDYILLVDKGQKTVSSTAGHNLMNGHAFATERFAQAHANLTELKDYLRSGDLLNFGELVESEALTLHAMMMTSRPYFILFKPHTIAIIEAIWAYRNETKTPVFFTLDAGANVHLLFPEAEKQNVDAFVKSTLLPYCYKGEYLCDRVGNGPTQLIVHGK
jgi:diphosphomevalonate decarboxylase